MKTLSKRKQGTIRKISRSTKLGGLSEGEDESDLRRSINLRAEPEIR